MAITSWKRITNNATIMTWTNQLVTVGGSLFILPLLLKMFDEIEISFWFLLNIFIQLTMLADSGFGPTLIRAVSYFKAGALSLPSNKKESEAYIGGNKEANIPKLTDLLFTTKKIYNIMSWGAVVLMGTVGTLITWNIFVLSDYRINFAYTFLLIIANSYIVLQILRWKSFMVGLNYVAKINGFNTLVGVARLVYSLVILFTFPSILYLIIFRVFSNLILFIYIRSFVRKWFTKQGCNLQEKRPFDKNIFLSIWSATWKMGGIQWGNYLINYGTTIIMAQISNTTLMANFLFTQRIIFIFRRIAEAPFYANIQRIYGLIAQKEYYRFKKLTSRYIFLVLFVLISSLLAVLIFGNWALSILNIETRIVATHIFIILAIAMVCEVHASIHTNIYLSTNQVPFLLPIVITGVVFLIIGFQVLPYYGLFGIILVQFLLQLSFNYWYPVVLSFRLMNWNILSYLKGLYTFGAKNLYSQALKEIGLIKT